jgi:hypothetical protein
LRRNRAFGASLHGNVVARYGRRIAQDTLAVDLCTGAAKKWLKRGESMRSLLIAAAALLAVVAPGIAAAETGGNIKLTIASVDHSNSFFDDYYCEGDCYYDLDSDGVVALSGVVITDVSPNWRIQFNGVSADANANFSYYYGDYSYEWSRAFSQVEVHATRAIGQFDVGVFTGLFNNEGTSYWLFGAEAAINFERGEISASITGATSPNSDNDYYSYYYGMGDDITSLAANGVFYVNENVAVGATVSRTDFGDNGYYYYLDSYDREVTSYGVHLAYNIPSTDFTVAVGYRASDTDFGDTDFFGVSLAWEFGEGSRGRVMPGGEALIPDAIALFDTMFVIS